MRYGQFNIKTHAFPTPSFNPEFEDVPLALHRPNFAPHRLLLPVLITRVKSFPSRLIS